MCVYIYIYIERERERERERMPSVLVYFFFPWFGGWGVVEVVDSETFFSFFFLDNRVMEAPLKDMGS